MEATYKGKLISDMTHEELIKALEQMSGLYMQTLIQRSEDLDNLMR